jgi:hypothetical protein
MCSELKDCDIHFFRVQMPVRFPPPSALLGTSEFGFCDLLACGLKDHACLAQFLVANSACQLAVEKIPGPARLCRIGKTLCDVQFDCFRARFPNRARTQRSSPTRHRGPGARE